MIIDQVGNLHEAGNGQFAGRAFSEADADQVLGTDQSGTAAGDSEPDPGYLVPSWGMTIANDKVDKANRRLARAGIEERFEASWGEPELVTERDDEGRDHTVEYRRLTLNHPRISYGGWRFVASLDETEAGMIVRSVPDADLEGYRPETAWCDHCGTRRQRNETYLVQHEDGTVMQVGSTCMQDFLGVQPKGLWAIGLDLGADAESEWSGRGGGSGEMLVDTRMVIASALVASSMGRDFRPSSFEHSTSDGVKDTLWFSGGSADQKAARRAAYEQAEALAGSAQVDEVIEAVRSMTGDSDYAVNMRTLIEGGHSRLRHAGMLASAVKVWAKDQEFKVRESRPRKQGFLAPEGTKLNALKAADGKPGVRATVEKAFVSESYFGYNPSYSTLVIMRTEDGQTLKWQASGVPDLENGSEIRLTGGSVKAHDNYQGVDQTAVTRVKWELVEADPVR